MLAAFPLSALVVVLSLFVYIWVTIKVGGARTKYNVPAPTMEGPIEFQRVFRVQMNTLEQLALFLPALVLFAAAWGDMAAAIVGVFWPIGRVIFALGYYKEPEKRAAGFGITFFTSAILLVGGLAGVVMQLLGAA